MAIPPDDLHFQPDMLIGEAMPRSLIKSLRPGLQTDQDGLENGEQANGEPENREDKEDKPKPIILPSLDDIIGHSFLLDPEADGQRFRAKVVEKIESSDQVMKGLIAGAQIEGYGIVEWLVEVNSQVVPLKMRALFVPSCEKRLMCPQQFNKEVHPDCPMPQIGGDETYLHFPQGTVICPNNESDLPELTLAAPKESANGMKALNACLTLDQNQNLTASQKELLKWHNKLGNCDLKRDQSVLKTGALGSSPLIKAASNVDLNKLKLLCGFCAFGKARRRSKTSKTNKTNSDLPKPETLEKLLSKDILIPGQRVSMDHFIVSTPGRLFTSKG
jgi:hypothetical protein